MTVVKRYDLFLLLGLPVLYAVVAVLIPPYFPLLQPDSADYIEFSSRRTALYPLFLKIFATAGLDLVQITHVQIGLFSLSLIVSLSSLLRVGVPRSLIVLFVACLCANVYFSSLHRTILTESIFCTVMMLVVAFLLDYLRSGKSVFLALAALGMSLLVGIRPAAIALLPMLIVAVWLKWRRRDVAMPALAAAIVVPIAMGILCERIAYHAQHGDRRDSVAGNHLIGRSAMLARPDIIFTGPHAGALTELGQKLYAIYAPVHEFLSHVPLPALPAFTATYEWMGQYHVMQREIADAAQRLGVSKDALLADLGKQIVLGNIAGQMRLFFIQYVGQWSIASLTFPPTARAVNQYIAGYPMVPLQRCPDDVGQSCLDDVVLHPQPHPTSYLIYPAFLAAGLLTFLSSFALIPLLVRPSHTDNPRLQHLFLAMFFSLTCQVYTIGLSLVTLATPRYLMAIFPEICLVGVFTLLAIWERLGSARPSANARP